MHKRVILPAIVFLLALAAVPLARAQGGGLLLQSADFAEGAAMPDVLTCKGAGLSPALAWRGLPTGAQSLALRVVDPDAPSGPFTHWLAWGIDPAQTGLGRGVAEGDHGLMQGRNSFGDIGYGGPCPPAGHGLHHYIFTLYALDERPLLPQGAGRDAFDDAIKGHILAATTLTGLYEVP